MRFLTGRRSITAWLALVLAVVVGAAVAGPVAAQGEPGPRPDAPNGASIELVTDVVTPGSDLSFTGSGFVNDRGQGQTVTVKLNDADILGAVEARADGTVVGSVVVPAVLPPGGYWLRFLAGAGKEDDEPARTLHRVFTLQAPGGTGSGPSTSEPSGNDEPGSDVPGDETAAGEAGAAEPAEGSSAGAASVAVAAGIAVVVAVGVVVAWRRRSSVPST